MSKVKELMEKRNDVLLKMTAIIDKAEEEVRAMAETEQQDYENTKRTGRSERYYCSSGRKSQKGSGK